MNISTGKMTECITQLAVKLLLNLLDDAMSFGTIKALIVTVFHERHDGAWQPLDMVSMTNGLGENKHNALLSRMKFSIFDWLDFVTGKKVG